MSTITVRKKLYIDGSLTKVKKLAEGMFEGIVATNAEDRHGEILDIKGLDTKAYMQTNPIVLFGHNYDDIFDVMGTTTNLKKTKEGQLVAQWKMSAVNPKAQLVGEMIKEGTINTLSIGFVPKEIEGDTYSKSEMVEFSIVPIPANAQAIITGKKLGLSEKEVKDILEEPVKKDVGDSGYLLGLLQEVAEIDMVVDRIQAELADYLGVSNPDTDGENEADGGPETQVDDAEANDAAEHGQDTDSPSNTVRGVDVSLNTKLELGDLDSVDEFIGKLKQVTGVLEEHKANLSPTVAATTKKKVTLVAVKKQLSKPVKQADRLVEAVLVELKNIN